MWIPFPDRRSDRPGVDSPAEHQVPDSLFAIRLIQSGIPFRQEGEIPLAEERNKLLRQARGLELHSTAAVAPQVIEHRLEQHCPYTATLAHL